MPDSNFGRSLLYISTEVIFTKFLLQYKFCLHLKVCVHRPYKKHAHNRLLPMAVVSGIQGNSGTSGQVVRWSFEVDTSFSSPFQKVLEFLCPAHSLLQPFCRLPSRRYRGLKSVFQCPSETNWLEIIITTNVMLVITCNGQGFIGSVDDSMYAAACHPAANAITFLCFFMINVNVPIASDIPIFKLVQAPTSVVKSILNCS